MKKYFLPEIFISAVLLVLSFPKWNLGFLAFLAFIPVFHAVHQTKSVRSSFLIFYVFGLLFYLVSMEWIRHVTLFGLFFVASVVSIYFGVFGAIVKLLLRTKKYGTALFIIPASWVMLEWMRTEIPVWALGWNLIGYSQTNSIAILKIAKTLGAYGISFLVLFVNAALCFVFQHEEKVIRLKSFQKLGALALLGAGIFVLLMFQPEEKPQKQNELLVSVIQGNIPQNEKWNPEFQDEIWNRYRTLTEIAAANPTDLIIWPEAAWPGFLNRDAKQREIENLSKNLGKHLLIGSLYEDLMRNHIYNSAFLISPKGLTESRYDKIRLVPFGEFVPAEWFFFGLFGLEKFAYSLGVGDFKPGSEYRVFELNRNGQDPVKFSTLICFEDTFPELARRFVLRGAEFLVVITNDAWFGRSAAAYQHLQASILRAVELGVPVVRSANTGVSAVISREGRVIERVIDKFGHDTWIMGGVTAPIELGNIQTPFARLGYLFPYFCTLASAIYILVLLSTIYIKK